MRLTEVKFDDLRQIVQRLVFDRSVVADARVIDQYVQAAVGRQLIHEPLPKRGIGEVARDGLDPVAALGGQIFEELRPAGRYYDVCTGGVQDPSKLSAKAR